MALSSQAAGIGRIKRRHRVSNVSRVCIDMYVPEEAGLARKTKHSYRTFTHACCCRFAKTSVPRAGQHLPSYVFGVAGLSGCRRDWLGRDFVLRYIGLKDPHAHMAFKEWGAGASSRGPVPNGRARGGEHGT